MQKTRNYIVIPVLLFVLITFVVMIGLAVAEDTPELLPIDPVAMVQISNGTTLQPTPPARIAIIEQIHPHCFVIGDTCRGFSSDAVFRSSVGGPATSRGAFHVGDYVGLRYNKNREVEEIWLAEPPVGIR